MHTNRIGDDWRPALSGHAFELQAARAPGNAARPSGTGSSGTIDDPAWPRSSAADVALALAALTAPAPRSWTAETRRTVLERAAADIADERGGRTSFARLLGLDDEEWRALGAGMVDDLHAASRSGSSASGTSAPGVVLIRCDWSELDRGLTREVFARLARGRSILLLSDGAAPMLAHDLVHALVEAGVPGARLALLHEDGEACVQEALRDPRVTSLVASGPSARMRELARRADNARPEAARGMGFGAGLEESRGLARDLRVLRNRTHVVTLADDVEASARAVLELGFSRRRALSGQAPDAVGRVACHERVFSRFTAALLAELEASTDLARPLSVLDPSITVHTRRALDLGLDEGATPIFSAGEILARANPPGTGRQAEDAGAAHAPHSMGGAGPADPSKAAERPASTQVADGAGRRAEAAWNARSTSSEAARAALSAGRSRRPRDDGSFFPLVFTNVEAHMRLAWLGRPAPLLCLLRVETDDRARELAREFDADALAEDLSGEAEVAAGTAGNAADDD